MNKCIEDTHEGVLVITEELHRNFAGDAEDSFYPSHSKAVNKVLSESEGNPFGCVKRFTLSACELNNMRGGLEYLLEETTEVNMDQVSVIGIQKDIFAVPISQPYKNRLGVDYLKLVSGSPQDESDHRHHCHGTPIIQATG